MINEDRNDNRAVFTVLILQDLSIHLSPSSDFKLNWVNYDCIILPIDLMKLILGTDQRSFKRLNSACNKACWSRGITWDLPSMSFQFSVTCSPIKWIFLSVNDLWSWSGCAPLNCCRFMTGPLKWESALYKCIIGHKGTWGSCGRYNKTGQLGKTSWKRSVYCWDFSSERFKMFLIENVLELFGAQLERLTRWKAEE